MNSLSIATMKKGFMRLFASVATTLTLAASGMFTTVASAASSAADSKEYKDADLKQVTTPIVGLINNIFNVLIPLVAAVGAIFCISLGVKYSRAEEPQEREKAKQHLKNAIIGFVLIFVLILALRLSTPILQKWLENND